MDYEYRNIDTDLELKKAAKRYWTEEEFTKEHMYLVLREHGYSEWEADRAINDYYHVYVWSRILTEKLFVFWSVVAIILLSLRLFGLLIE